MWQKRGRSAFVTLAHSIALSTGPIEENSVAEGELSAAVCALSIAAEDVATSNALSAAADEMAVASVARACVSTVDASRWMMEEMPEVCVILAGVPGP
jgi:hypothetical protein